MSPEPATARLSFVTLEQFLEQLPPELKMLHDGGSGASLLRWVEPSELEDPTPYLPEGEFLLTAGLPFLGEGGSAAKVDAYVQRLVEAKVAALGFGIRPYFDTVPDVLIDACRRYNLTLFEVPESVPFAAIGLEFSQLLETDNARVFRQLADTNRQLMRAVLSPRPEHELLPRWSSACRCGLSWWVRTGGYVPVGTTPAAAPASNIPSWNRCWEGCCLAAGHGLKWTVSTSQGLPWCSAIRCAAPRTPTSVP